MVFAVRDAHRALDLVKAFTKASLSLTLRPTLLALPSLARASATLSKTLFSSELVLSVSSDSSKVSLLLTLSSYTKFPGLDELRAVGGSEVLWTLSAILTRIQWVGLLRRFQRKLMYVLGIGVVMSAAV